MLEIPLETQWRGSINMNDRCRHSGVQGMGNRTQLVDSWLILCFPCGMTTISFSTCQLKSPCHALPSTGKTEPRALAQEPPQEPGSPVDSPPCRGHVPPLCPLDTSCPIITPKAMGHTCHAPAEPLSPRSSKCLLPCL